MQALRGCFDQSKINCNRSSLGFPLIPCHPIGWQGIFFIPISYDRGRRPQAAGRRPQAAGRRPQDRGRRAQAAGHRAPNHDSRAQARSAKGADRISPHHRAAGRRSSILDPCNSTAKPPSNKYTSPSEGQCNRKKLTPLHLVCERCHAICDFDRATRPALIIFNSHQIGTPSMHR